MAGGILEMSGDERERSHLVRGFVEARLCQREASESLGIGVRQFKRLVCAWRRDGDAGLVSRQHGRPSNRRLDDTRRAEIEALLKDKYAGFGATLASEKLLELDRIEVSVETVRQMQISLGLWKPKARRAKRVFQLRERRSRFGELIQIDGSPHDWFEGRGPRCTVIVFIDDATGRLTGCVSRRSSRAKPILRHCAITCSRTAARWRFVPTGMAFSGSTPRMPRAAMARPNSAGWWNVWRSG
jgi:transposase